MIFFFDRFVHKQVLRSHIHDAGLSIMNTTELKT